MYEYLVKPMRFRTNLYINSGCLKLIIKRVSNIEALIKDR